MRRTALIYASRDAQTRAIAVYLRDRLESQGDHLHLVDISKGGWAAASTAPADAYLIVAPVRGGRLLRAVVRWVRKHRQDMHGKRIGLFTVSLNAVDSRYAARAPDDAVIKQAIDACGVAPNFSASLAVARRYKWYGRVLRRLMRRSSTSAARSTDIGRDQILTDKDAVDRFAAAFARDDAASPFATARQFADQRVIDSLMPLFEQSCSYEWSIDKSPAAVWHAFEAVKPADMPLARSSPKRGRADRAAVEF